MNKLRRFVDILLLPVLMLLLAIGTFALLVKGSYRYIIYGEKF